MLLDNKDYSAKGGKNHPTVVFDFFRKYLKEDDGGREIGKLSAVTGYFSPAGLARFHEHFDKNIEEYKLIIGELATTESARDKIYQLLSDNHSLKNGVTNSLKDSGTAIEFLKQEKVKAKTLKPNFCHAKAYLFEEQSNDPQKNFLVVGSSNLTEAGMGLKHSSNIELNKADFGGNSDYLEFKEWFNELWEHSNAKDTIEVDGKLKPFKDYLISLLSDYHKKYTPNQLYYKVLYERFKKDLNSVGNDAEFQNQLGSLENTVVWNTLFKFQQKGVISLIKMLRNYNGAILADAVGLGKTWQALAVMKFYQMRNYEVILLCPKRLHKNWIPYQKRRGSRFEADRLEYVVRWHTDLQEDRIGEKDDGFTLEDYFQSDKPKLLVIDESHNLRNKSSQRYEFLMEQVLKKNQDIKVLLLSATPINTKLSDVLNQFLLFTKGNPHGFKKSLGVFSLYTVFRTANEEFVNWCNDANAKLDDLIHKLGDNFLMLTDKMIVARTRELIKQEGLVFPENKGATNHYINPENIGNINSFEQFFDALPVFLAGYKPSVYTEPLEKPVSAIDDARIQDTFLVKMMHTLLIKRYESSWKSFQSTIAKVLAHHENALKKSLEYKKLSEEARRQTEKLEVDPNLDIDEDELEDAEDYKLGKREIKIADIDSAGNLEEFIACLEDDVDKLSSLNENLNILDQLIGQEKGLKSKDTKLEQLMKVITAKQISQGNDQNKKLIIFTTFSDTAMYLYDELKKRGFERLAVVTGTDVRSFDHEQRLSDFEPILQRFAPYTKLFLDKTWPEFEENRELSKQENYSLWKQYIHTNKTNIQEKLDNPIDILIATDCLSEGQNLQDADMVVNYDVHWNPVRLIQRFGRIDRIGSPNIKDGVSAVNFWPAPDIDTYLNLQTRIEMRVTAIRIGGGAVPDGFQERFKEKNESQKIKEIQKKRMMKQMEASIEEIEDEKSFSFADLSLETYRQELYELLKSKQKELESIPNGVFTGFKPIPELFEQNIPEGMIALMGYPAKPTGKTNHEYIEYHLMYSRDDGTLVFTNPHEILSVLKSQKNNKRRLPAGLDSGKQEVLDHYSSLLIDWLNSHSNANANQAVRAIMDGDIQPIANIEEQEEQAYLEEKFKPENFDLICWFAIKN